ncbi:LD-carboxypeptidase [Ideonella sp. A 288]|uniref:S66 peptidase family protein n=1 Tax=Ideonella sp. A 288 TaxID=1962181 RepID=UPI001F2CE402|nr:LD-carboxypeptidase [Ideonella sp. A 288]
MDYAPFRCLAPGATVAIVAPAGPADEAAVQAVPELVAAQGWRARLYPSCEARGGWLAGPDDARLADLHAAIADERNAAVWCLRGGYGSGRLLDRIDVNLLRRHPKPLIGYSDITALHALWDRAGLLALHAPMPASDLVKPGREADAQALWHCLRDGLRAGTMLAPVLADGAMNIAGRARGRLVGGNLSLIASLCGTPWQLRTQGRLLFLEDVSEATYRVDRLLLQLRLAGLLDAAAGFVLGSFTEDEDPRAVLDAVLRPLGKPVLGGWPAGHGTPNRPLPLGAMATLDAGAGTLTIEQDVLVG